MAILVLLNNFLHDFSAAGWFIGSVLLWSMLKKDMTKPETESAIIDILKTVLQLMRISFIGIVVFGIVRTLAYKTYEWNAAAGESQVTLLIVKHIILTGLFALGLFYYIKASKLGRKAVNGKTK